MRILVCGGRDYADLAHFTVVLDGLHRAKPITAIIQGGCPTGADRMAKNWACANGVDDLEWGAEWAQHGRRAGPIRNRQMLEEGRPDFVVAFDTGGPGTRNMIQQALDHDLAVMIADGAFP